MKKIIAMIVTLMFAIAMIPSKSIAAGGIFASGGGSKTVGQTFTVTVSASGADFDSLQGTISVSGPVDIISFSGGGATWLPGKAPSNGGQFVGITGITNSLTVATVKLKGKSVGRGTVSVSGAKLARNGAITGTGAGNADFSIEKAPELPGTVKVSSSSHPDSNVAYEVTTIALAWNKESGVDGFSYLLDQVATTTPPAKITDANVSATYADKAVGTYYFHVRAHKPDGWGAATHFKINIKEPDAKIDENLPKPHDIKIEKAPTFIDDVKDGTVSGITISGITEPGFTANISLAPVPTLPEGKKLSILADSDGKFSLLIDFPIVSGFHKLTVQGQKEKILTSISDEVRFEISQAKGGTISMISDEDIVPPAPVKAEETSQPLKLNKQNALYLGASILGLAIIIILIVFFTSKRKNGQILKSLKSK